MASPADRVRLATEYRKPLLDFDEYALRGLSLVAFIFQGAGPREGKPLRGEVYRYRLRAREAMYEADFEAIAELEQYHYAGEGGVALWVCPRCGQTLF
ncbi:hypothetical protein AN926_12115, partial [Thermus scotoductus]